MLQFVSFCLIWKKILIENFAPGVFVYVKIYCALKFVSEIDCLERFGPLVYQQNSADEEFDHLILILFIVYPFKLST